MPEDAPAQPSPRAKPPMDLLLAIALAQAAVACALALPEGNPARAALAIPFLLFLPGYAITTALWPGDNAEGKAVDTTARIALSIGLSIVSLSFVGLCASLLGTLSLVPVLAGNMAVLLTFSLLAFYRRGRLAEGERYDPFAVLRAPSSGRVETALTLGVAAAIIVSVSLVTYMLVMPAPQEPYSEFYLLDSEGLARDYPNNITANETATVIVGIACHENAATDYAIVTSLFDSTGNATESSWDSPVPMTNATVLGRTITLEDGGVFEDSFSFYFQDPGTYKVTCQLLVNGQPTDYKVHIWVTVNPA